jgi:hypothetical protein
MSHNSETSMHFVDHTDTIGPSDLASCQREFNELVDTRQKEGWQLAPTDSLITSGEGKGTSFKVTFYRTETDSEDALDFQPPVK